MRLNVFFFFLRTFILYVKCAECEELLLFFFFLDFHGGWAVLEREWRGPLWEMIVTAHVLGCTDAVEWRRWRDSEDGGLF